jgi:hypothetical protein
LGLLTINSFTAADEIIIPLQAQFCDARFGQIGSRMKKNKAG